MSEATEKIHDVVDGLNEKSPFLIIGIVAVIVLCVDYFGVMQFQLGTLKSLNEKIETVTQDLQSAEISILREPQYKAEMEKLNLRFKDIRRNIKSKEEIPLIMENISRIANKYNVRIEQIMPDTYNEEEILENEDGVYSLLPIVVEVSSGYHEFGRFLNAIECEWDFLRIPMFSIVAKANEQTWHAMKLTINAIILEEDQGQ
ncbi:MAG: type 4a pilus biogenesis protein PilO [Candidatus Omnitrophica bacterium]|nr:type 4a pilus biogenesis protein PilO [Candidatus Omnitrophota bacterium]